MDFDERIITRRHVLEAIEKYLTDPPSHLPARSAFLLLDGRKLPAKFILRLAFEIATGNMPRPETLTGGKASIRVLQDLGFYNAVYEKENVVGGKRNEVKSARRNALRAILLKLWGPVEVERRIQLISVPDLQNRVDMDPTLHQILRSIENHRQLEVHGKNKYLLKFDFFLPRVDVAIEFDERQHFTPLRAAALKAYPSEVELGFDKERWIHLSERIRAGDNSPIYRDEQRAFYDSVRDLLAPRVGLKPVIRIFEEDVHWEVDVASTEAKSILDSVESVINS